MAHHTVTWGCGVAVGEVILRPVPEILFIECERRCVIISEPQFLINSSTTKARWLSDKIMVETENGMNTAV
jgi:hypothetical protein